jgi:FkbM family methyltransferase
MYDEILCFAHVLKLFDPPVLAYVRDRVALDIGAYDGDSAVVLMDYAKEVYSFEPSPMNFRKLRRILSLNQHHFGSGQAFQLALSNYSGTARFTNTLSPMAAFSSTGGVEVTVTTLDEFLSSRDVKIGFVKSDTEGQGIPVLMGAEKTLKKHGPVFALAVYHNLDEFLGIPRLLQEWLPNYEFGWEFGVDSIHRWHELVFTGYPREIYEKRQR